MPELPEVETVKRILESQLAKESVLSVEIHNPQVIAHPDAVQFADSLAGQTVKSLHRRGKFLTMQMQSGNRVVMHLRMARQFLVTSADYPIEKHTHLVAKMSGGRQLRYIDVRRFRRFWLLKTNEIDTVTGQAQLGMEPLDGALTGEYLQSKLQPPESRSRKCCMIRGLLPESATFTRMKFSLLRGYIPLKSAQILLPATGPVLPRRSERSWIEGFAPTK